MIMKLKKTNFINFISNFPILINCKDINKIVVSNKIPFGKKDVKLRLNFKDF